MNDTEKEKRNKIRSTIQAHNVGCTERRMTSCVGTEIRYTGRKGFFFLPTFSMPVIIIIIKVKA